MLGDVRAGLHIGPDPVPGRTPQGHVRSVRVRHLPADLAQPQQSP